VLSSLGDLFRLQDDIAHRVVDALSLPLAGAGASPTPDAPRDAQAYGLYLRANELARTYDQLPQARSLYQCCIELDPRFAPAWAQLGRCHRVIGKYIDASDDTSARAEDAFRRALELNPRLSVAHKYYANLEADTGHAESGMVRLLREADRHGNDPELFAGLVHACRYCGLNEQSIAAHHEARRLDPNVPASLEQTLLMAGDLESIVSVERPLAIGAGDSVIRVIALALAGRREDARRTLFGMRDATRVTAFRTWSDFLLAWIERRPADMRTSRLAVGKLEIMDDPEAIFQEGWLYCEVGEHEQGLGLLQRAVTKGYFVAETLSGSRQFDALRNEPAFRDLLEESQRGRDRALAAFRTGGGERLLGVEGAYAPN
jgi:tetratricopeptide (TPR) repeat protein